LRAHSGEFRREIIKVTDGVWAAVGFSNANSVLIEGEGGSIVVDTTSHVEDAKQVRAEFAKLSPAPVRAIIYIQWTAELTDYVLAIDGGHVEAKRLKANALTGLGERQISAIARNYYLSAAQYLLRDLPPR
jgi:alkyl sulfatase BDS1-like metallo-beta-lactamase superfamily hydrolase